MPALTIGAGRALLSGGVKGIVLPGIAGNYASAPDSAALSITGDITLDTLVALDDWTPSGNQAIAAKWAGNGTRSYWTFINSLGRLGFQASVDGTASTVNVTSSASPSIADGGLLWLRTSCQVNDGLGNNVVQFYSSGDGVQWTQVGTTRTTAGTLTIFDSTQILEIGTMTTGTASLLVGKVRRVRIYASYLQATVGNPAFDVDFSLKQPGAKTLLDSAGGALVTINGTLWRDSQN